MNHEDEIVTIARRAPGAGKAGGTIARRPARRGATWRPLAVAAGLALGCVVLWPAPTQAQSVSDGITAFRQGDLQTARDIWQPLAEAGDPVAQFNLGKLYEYGGDTVRQDYAEAARWYREAADQGIAEAQNNLGLMYAQGLGVPRDPRRAAELWKQAADNDYGLAQYNLALAVFRGEGVSRDERVAVIWFERAARAGLPDAQYAMGQLMRLGRAGPRDEGQALTWYQMAAAQGHDDAASQAAALRERGVVAKAPVPIGPARTADAPGEAAAAETAAEEGASVATLPVPEPKPEPVSEPQPEPQPEPLAAAPEAPQQAAATPAAEPDVGSGSGPDVESGAAAANVGPDDGGGQGAQAGAEYRLWLVSADSQVAAEELRDETLERHGEALGGVGLDIYQVDYGERGHFYRVLAGPIHSADAANQLCRRLREDDPQGFCKVLTR